MAVNSTNSTSSWSQMFGISNKGIGGLATGLDTESLVKALTSGTQLKITKQQQQRQLLTWRQDGYRAIITALSAFQKKSFQNTGATTSTTNMLHSNFFSTYKSTSSSDKISVSAGSRATLGEIKIDRITEMATAQSLKSKDLGNLAISFGTDFVNADGDSYIDKSFDNKLAFSGETLKIQFNGSNKTVKLDQLNNALELGGDGKYYLNEANFEAEMQDILNKNFAASSSGSNVKLVQDGGQYTLASDTGWLTVEGSNGKLGIAADQSNHLVTSNTLAQMDDRYDNFKLKGSLFSFSINDTVITMKKGETIGDLVDRVNKSDANVRMDYNGNTGRFTITSKATGGADNIRMRDISGNLMNQIFGAQGGGSLNSTSLIKNTSEVSSGLNPWAAAVNGRDPLTDAAAKADLKSLAKSYKTFDITINGTTKAVRVDLSSISSEKLNNGTFTEQEYIDAINKSINYTFGSTDVFLEKASKTVNGVTENGYLKISTSPGSSSIATMGMDSGTIGFSQGQSNYINDINYNGAIGLGGFGLTKNGSLYEMPSAGKINVSVGSQTAAITIDLSPLNGLKVGSKAAKDATDAINDNIKTQLTNAFGADANKINLSISNPYEETYHQQKITGEDGNIYEVYKEQKSVKAGSGTYYEFLDKDGKTVYGDKAGNFFTKDGSSYDPVADNQAYTDQLAAGTMKRVSTNTNVYVRGGVAYSDTTGTVIKDGTGDLAYNANAGFVSVQAAQQYAEVGGKLYHGYVDKETGTKYYQDKDGGFFAWDGTQNAGAMAAATPDKDKLDVLYEYRLKQSASLSLGVSNDTEVKISAFTNTADPLYKASFFEDIGFKDTDGNAGTVSTGNFSDNADTLFSELVGGGGLNGTLTFSEIMAGGSPLQVTYGSTMTLRQFVDDINTRSGGALTAEVRDGRLAIAGTDGTIKVSDSGALLTRMFGLDTNTYETDGQDNAVFNSNMTMGKNMEIEINGQKLSYETNSITIDGVNITVKGKTVTGTAGADESITINTVSDATETMDRIKSWMDDYNALVHTLNQSVTETRPKSNGNLYDPLTDEQKAEMSESEITKWETEAKKGMLYNDAAIKAVLSELRQSLYERVEAAGLSLWDLGIQTVNSLDPLEYGKLEFAPPDYSKSGMGGEDRLRKLLETEPDRVRTFFQDENGLANKINNIISKAANTSSVNRGTLVKIAGTETNTGDNTSTLGNKMEEIDNYISNLKLRLESEYNRYWKQFTALETAVSKMNSQSSWLQSNAG